MDPYNSLDEFNIIAALLHDVYCLFGDAISISQRRNTLEKVRKRCTAEGLSFLTKTLPKLGKRFDQALLGTVKLTAIDLRFNAQKNSVLPRFLGELFNLIFQPDGSLLPQPNLRAVGCIRDICYLFYKYKVPYTDEQKNKVIFQFLRTEDDLSTVQVALDAIRGVLDNETSTYVRRKNICSSSSIVEVAREARITLSKLFTSFNPLDIYPKHGPGAVATKQRLWEKFQWTNISSKITRSYPLDEFYFSSLGHVCDCLPSIQTITDCELPARVILVNKDSRGPRLISCEPVDYQWIQQGLGSAIVDLVETHPLTKWNVHFTDQGPNRCGALLGSKTGSYATLDLKEASDRISLSLVRLLFPLHVYTYLESCRTSSTELPDGRIINLKKFAPMGSSLCFPILATCIWAILHAAAPDEYTRERILVYGDDVIVPTAFAEDAMNRLESFGLLINRDKSCTSGFFRESCGADAFKGINVTPVRIKTVWSESPSPDIYTSYIAYANELRRRSYYTTYERIAGALHHVYGAIPATDMLLTCPSLDDVPLEKRPKKFRINHHLQRKEWLVRDISSPIIVKELPGWSMLLRFFTEAVGRPIVPNDSDVSSTDYSAERTFKVRQYTRRSTTLFKRTWRAAERPSCQVCLRNNTCDRQKTCHFIT